MEASALRSPRASAAVFAINPIRRPLDFDLSIQPQPANDALPPPTMRGATATHRVAALVILAPELGSSAGSWAALFGLNANVHEHGDRTAVWLTGPWTVGAREFIHAARSQAFDHFMEVVPRATHDQGGAP